MGIVLRIVIFALIAFVATTYAALCYFHGVPFRGDGDVAGHEWFYITFYVFLGSTIAAGWYSKRICTSTTKGRIILLLRCSAWTIGVLLFSIIAFVLSVGADRGPTREYWESHSIGLLGVGWLAMLLFLWELFRVGAQKGRAHQGTPPKAEAE